MEKRNVLPPTLLYASVAIMVALHFLLPVLKVISSPLHWLGIIPFVICPDPDWDCNFPEISVAVLCHPWFYLVDGAPLYYRRRAHAGGKVWSSLERL
jgi:hypothetical protein